MNSSRWLRLLFVLCLLASGPLFLSITGDAKPTLGSANTLASSAIPSDPQIPSKQLLSVEELNQMLKSQKPLVLQVGPRSMYQQAHIPGAEFVGGASTPEGLEALRARAKSLPKNQLMVIYCGCCPWGRCPNVHPAYKLLRDLGYTGTRVLYLAENFGVDWVQKGYPIEKGN